jgi:hypothetical protein
MKLWTVKLRVAILVSELAPLLKRSRLRMRAPKKETIQVSPPVTAELATRANGGGGSGTDHGEWGHRQQPGPVPRPNVNLLLTTPPGASKPRRRGPSPQGGGVMPLASSPGRMKMHFSAAALVAERGLSRGEMGSR